MGHIHPIAMLCYLDLSAFVYSLCTRMTPPFGIFVINISLLIKERVF